MPAYVIAKKDDELLDTPVFYAGESGTEEAIAVFTARDVAARYIEDAGWNADHEVGELTAIDLLRWIVKAHDEGTQYLAVNPVHHRQVAGEEQKIIVIEGKLASFAEALTRDILATAFDSATERRLEPKSQ
jgi:hypothetical protein